MSDLFPLGSAMKEKLSISSEERSQLEEFVRRRSSPQWLVQRSTILLKLTSGTGIRPLARSLEISRNTVRFWRDRWRSGTALRNGNGLPEAPPLSERLIRTLSDRPRPGGPQLLARKSPSRLWLWPAGGPKSSAGRSVIGLHGNSPMKPSNRRSSRASLTARWRIF